MITKEMGLKIAEALISGEKVRGDYGSAALKESQEIIANLIEVEKLEKETKSMANYHAPRHNQTIADLEK